MSLIQRLVPPKLPTVLADDTEVDLPGYDTYFYPVPLAWVVPTRLDVSKFEEALSRVLQAYPHAAGRLRSTDGRWFIELTNTPVPVDVEYKLNVSSDSVLDPGWVVQDDLSAVVSEPSSDAQPTSGSAPLFSVKLTLFDHETCIGITWNHALGDGFTALPFMHMLSQLYQDLPPEFAAPSFKKHHFPEPSPAMMAAFASRMGPRPANQTDGAAPPKSNKESEHVRWHFDNRDLEELRSALGANGQSKKRLSKQDCLTAYLVAVLNHHKGDPVKRVKTVCSYRHIRAPFIDENVAGNLILTVPANVPADLAGVAIAIREAVEQFREPSRITLLGSLYSEHVLGVANSGKLPTPSSSDDELFVNSSAVFDWCRAHFGFPDGTRFHRSEYFNQYLRTFKSNPSKGEDGAWRARQSVEISMGVPAGLKQKVLETLGRGVRYMLDDQRVQAE